MAVPFLHVQARGTYRELGRAVGEAAREQVRAAVEYYEANFPALAGVTFAEAERVALAHLPFARRYLPQYVEELEGMAEAAGLPFVKLLVPNCAEELTTSVDGRPPLAAAAAAGACTAAAVAAGGRHVVGHNMDWYVVDLDKNVLFDLTAPDGTRIVTIAGVPYLPILGMNSHGIAYVGNSVHCTDGRPGLPNVFVRRWALEAATLEEAVARASHPQRARGSNHLLADRDGRLWDLETSARAAVLTEHGESAAHTNHYVTAPMALFEGNHHEESRQRLAVAERLLADGLARGREPLQVVAEVLRSHEGAPDCICGHPGQEGEDPLTESVTVASMLCDLDAMELHACAGPPCENPYRTFPVA